jgi:hypothetical protein
MTATMLENIYQHMDLVALQAHVGVLRAQQRVSILAGRPITDRSRVNVRTAERIYRSRTGRHI